MDRVNAVEKLREIETPRAHSLLIACLSHKTHLVRSEAARLVGDKGIREAIPALMNALNDEAEPVRSSAALSLGDLIEGSVHDLRLLGKCVILHGRGPQDEKSTMQVRYLGYIYRGLAGRLRQKCMDEHKGMQEPPKRFRGVPAKPGRRNTEVQRRMAVGGARK
jgi:hypothetical protein